MDPLWGGSSISWTIYKSFAPHSRQIAMPAPHHFFTGWMLFVTPNQQCQSTEGTRFRLTLNVAVKLMQVLKW